MTNINRQLKGQITQLERQEEFLSIIYDNVREAIFVIDVADNGQFYYQGLNPAAKKFLGVEDIVNKTPAQIFPHQIAITIENNYQKCLEAKATIAYEEYVSFQGRDSWWLTTLNPIEDETGKIYRIVGTSLDITERKTMELELDKKNNFWEIVMVKK